jgi:hypothetical protein
MYNRLDRAHRALSVFLGSLTLFAAGIVLLYDAWPRVISTKSHDILAASSLALIGAAYLIYQAAHRPPWREWAKALLLAFAFFFWAANQVWPDPHQAVILNDIAIALFVLDVFLVMVGWPPSSPDESFGETYSDSPGTGPGRA